MIAVNYIGQCGFVIFNDKLAFAVDPVLNDLVGDDGHSIRNYPPVLSYDELEVDYIFCTHDHIDHMAKETLTAVAEIDSTTKFVVPAGCVKEVVSWGINEDRVIGLSDGETKEFVLDIPEGESVRKAGRIKVKGISAAHPVHQVDDEGLDHNLVYCFEMDDKKLVHLGDTYMTERLEKELRSLGHVDVLFPPINGRDEEREAKGIIGNLSCEEAAQLADKLRVELTIPTHFDMVAGNTADPFDFAECLWKLNQENKCWIPTLREQYVIM